MSDSRVGGEINQDKATAFSRQDRQHRHYQVSLRERAIINRASWLLMDGLTDDAMMTAAALTRNW